MKLSFNTTCLKNDILLLVFIDTHEFRYIHLFLCVCIYIHIYILDLQNNINNFYCKVNYHGYPLHLNFKLAAIKTWDKQSAIKFLSFLFYSFQMV